MQISSVNNVNNYPYKLNQLNFKQGLTPEILNRVKNMNPDEHKEIVKKLSEEYGINARVRGSNTVAYCLELAAAIIKRAGFSIAKNFVFEPIEEDYYGEYDIDGIVRINSNYHEYLDIESLNKMEESNNSEAVFIETYLHELVHSGHCDNIAEKKGLDKAKDIFFNKITDIFPPKTMILQPLQNLINTIYPAISNEHINDLFPLGVKMFSVDNLIEYFAEKNTKFLSTRLGNNLNIDNVPQNYAADYVGFPEDWNIEQEVEKMERRKDEVGVDNAIAEFLSNQLGYFEGEIWDGEINKIRSITKRLKNYTMLQRYRKK